MVELDRAAMNGVDVLTVTMRTIERMRGQIARLKFCVAHQTAPHLRELRQQLIHAFSLGGVVRQWSHYEVIPLRFNSARSTASLKFSTRLRRVFAACSIPSAQRTFPGS